jgi:hypothetical protein
MAPDTDRQWRVVVDTRNGGLGSGTLSVAAGWRPATLTFVARGAAPFTLAVGSAAAVSTAVSRADLLMGASSVAVAARLGEALPVEEDADAQSSGKDPDAKRRYMLWAALLLAVGSLGAIAWRLARGAQIQAGAQAGGVAGGVANGGGGTGGVGGADGLPGGVPSGPGAASATVKDAGAADADGQSTGKS